jgi:WD40 repeat protein
MKIEELTWLSEKKESVYSIDFHPKRKIFAFCLSNKIKIFKYDIIEKDEIIEKYKIDKYTTDEKYKENLISELNVHNNNVNCVRFSPDGNFLAACSDDLSISISTNTFLNEKEIWVQKKQIFNAHIQDILGYFPINKT